MFDLAITAYYFIQRESDSRGCTIVVANLHASWKEHLQVHGVHEKALLIHAILSNIYSLKILNAVEDYRSG